MSGYSHIGESPAILRVVAWLVSATLLGPTGDTFAGQSPQLTPILRPGQIVQYLINGRLQRSVKTESRVRTILEPRVTKIDFSSILRARVLDVSSENGQQIVTASAEFLPASAGASFPAEPPEKSIKFTMASNGQLTRLEGLNDLDESQQLAWQFWIARFGFGATVPSDKQKPGERWKSEEPVPIGAPIAGLFWDRQATNGPSTPCPVKNAETCAVFLTTADLKQKSSVKDSTPEEYRIKGLHTSGTANGENEIYTAVSLQSGLVMRASEDANQTMKVLIVKPDASNGVQYSVDVRSHFELLFVDSK